ncbi:hypothetical protein IAW_05815 [Bacillus cereus str. Schrouff]|uniref:Ig-like domain-containing protein n=1 Tax=Bacillus cereus TaxID=1396 RepID=UPI00032E00D0|nr:Ig-like domain-containing protein [Bacillus cereus]EOO04997.1 hypothetical protein IAW_05815 [Bacillus cereus str. Schrouff]EOO81669.1 hypothetical protein IGY_05691 [Bacillus cereus K-5975c]
MEADYVTPPTYTGNTTHPYSASVGLKNTLLAVDYNNRLYSFAYYYVNSSGQRTILAHNYLDTPKAPETLPEAPKVNEVKDTDEKVTGQAKKGSKVSVKVGEQELGTGEVDETGKYSVTIPKQKAGTKLQVTASNSAGTSEVTEVRVQETETIPEAPQVNEVKDTDEKVTGQAKKGSKVSVKVGDQEIGTGEVDETGKYSVTIPKQKAGTKLQVTASNSAGTSEVTEVRVQETETIPEAPEVNEVKDTDEKVTGQAKKGSKVAVKVGDQEIGTGEVDENGGYSIAISKQKAGTKLQVTASNSAGTSEVTEVTVTETKAEVNAPTISDYYQTNVNVKGTAEGASKVVLYVDGEVKRVAGVGEDGKYTIYTGDIAKLHEVGAEFEVAARDADGRESAKTKGIVKA